MSQWNPNHSTSTAPSPNRAAERRGEEERSGVSRIAGEVTRGSGVLDLDVAALNRSAVRIATVDSASQCDGQQVALIRALGSGVRRGHLIVPSTVTQGFAGLVLGRVRPAERVRRSRIAIIDEI